MTPFRMLTIAVTSSLVMGCQGEGTITDGALVTDSAGIRLVLNSPPSGNVAGLDLSGSPLVTVGLAEGPDEFLLFRVAGAAQLSDGRIVVADGGSLEVRYFDPSGTHLRTVGGRGDGPGELSFVSGIWRTHGDSVLAYDLNRRSMSVFDEQGDYVRSFAVEGTGSTSVTSLAVRGVLLDGRLVVVGPTESQMVGGISRNPVATYLLDQNGLTESLWAEFPGSETSVVVEGGGATGYPVLFGRRFHIAAAGGRIAAGNDPLGRAQLFLRCLPRLRPSVTGPAM